jgi:formate/nitrite transporter FocA (FNT family)
LWNCRTKRIGVKILILKITKNMKRNIKTIALLAIFAGAFMSSCTEDEYSMENGSEIEYSYKTTMSPVKS